MRRLRENKGLRFQAERSCTSILAYLWRYSLITCSYMLDLCRLDVETFTFNPLKPSWSSFTSTNPHSREQMKVFNNSPAFADSNESTIRCKSGKAGCVPASVGARARRACEGGEGWLAVEGLSAFTHQPLSCGIRASGRQQQGEWATTHGT